MTEEQKKRFVELITKVGSVDEINELTALILIDRSHYTKENILQYREFAWKNGLSATDAHLFLKQNCI